jgi:hypothetical protein
MADGANYVCGLNLGFLLKYYLQGWISQYSDSLRTGQYPGRGEIFSTVPDRPWGPTSPLLYNGYRVFLGFNGVGARR